MILLPYMDLENIASSEHHPLGDQDLAQPSVQFMNWFVGEFDVDIRNILNTKYKYDQQQSYVEMYFEFRFINWNPVRF